MNGNANKFLIYIYHKSLIVGKLYSKTGIWSIVDLKEVDGAIKIAIVYIMEFNLVSQLRVFGYCAQSDINLRR